MAVRRHLPARSVEPLGDIIGRLFAMRGWGRRQERLLIEEAWKQVAGNRAAFTQVGTFRRGVLEVVVGSSIVLQEMAQYQKRDLLQKLQRQLPSIAVTDLRFRAGLLGE